MRGEGTKGRVLTIGMSGNVQDMDIEFIDWSCQCTFRFRFVVVWCNHSLGDGSVDDGV